MAYEFGSPAWLDVLGGLILGAIGRTEQARQHAGLPPLTFSMCEVFTDPPAHLGGAGERIAWHCVVENGHVLFETREADAVAYKIVADYQTILPIARLDTDASPEGADKMAAMFQAGIAAGKVKTIGARVDDGGPPPLDGVHNAIARLTA